MRLSVGTNRAHLLSRVAVLALVAGLASGCSSDVERFQDGLFTGSTDNQRQIIRPPANQPYPGDVQQTASLDQTYTGSVSRHGVRRSDLLAGPLSRDDLEPINGASTAMRPAPMSEPPAQSRTLPPPSNQTVMREPVAPIAAPASNRPQPQLDRTPTGSTPPRAEAPLPRPATPVQERGGWQSSNGGTEVTIGQGETLYHLSRRYGVPVDAIMKANGLRDADHLAAGQKVIIPTYAYSSDAPVSAPDADPKVAKAGAATTKKDDRVPLPSKSPERVAVLPQATKPKERDEKTAPETTAKSAPAEAGGVYTVVAGDSLWGIAKRTGTTTTALKQANGLSSGSLQIGQKLKIPAGGRTPVQTADASTSQKKVDPIVTGAAGPASKHEKAANESRDDRAIEDAVQETAAVAPDATGIARMRWPVRGRVISAFGGKDGAKSNDGIDIAVPEGTAVKAAENGVVIYAGDGLKEFGNTVLVRHEDGLVTVYGHASKLEVSRGDNVKRGQEIARSGMSGNAESPRLHFEVRKDSAPVDPKKFLE